MIEKAKTVSPYLLILFLVALLIGFNSWTSRVEAGDTSATQVQVGNTAPVVSSVSLADGDNINLTENTTTTITVRALITDQNSCEDVWDGSVKAYIYQATQYASCSADTDNCYQIASCSTDATRNNCTGSSDTDLIVGCTADLYYFAEPTDGTSSNSSDEWYGAVMATDLAGDDHIASSSTQTVDVVLSRALEASSSIDYSSVAAGSDTGSSPIEMGVENTGNSGMDPQISATTTLVCTTAGTCGSDTIADGNQEYSLTSGFSYGSGTDLTGSGVQLNTVTPKPASDTFPVDDQIFWGLGVDGGQAPGTYEGVNTFTAAGD